MFGFLIILILLFILFFYNNLVHLRNIANNSKSLIDVYLQQRFDLIPNLVDVTKKYTEYEKDILTKISELRTSFNEKKDNESLSQLNDYYSSMIAVAEKYPDLKASEQFLNLQKNLSKVESELQAARRLYNNDVTRYNTKITIFPYNILAKIFGFKKMDLFVSNNKSEVKVDF